LNTTTFFLNFSVKNFQQSRFGIPEIGGPFPPVRCLKDAGWDVGHTNAILVFVAMLSTFSCSAVELYPEIIIAAFHQSIVDFHVRVQDSNRHRGGVNTPTTFRRGNALQTQTTSFIGEIFKIVALDLKGNFKEAYLGRPFTNGPVQSADAGEEFLVGASKLSHKQFAIVAAFRAFNFQNTFHQ
jgi:hypothetical protein